MTEQNKDCVFNALERLRGNLSGLLYIIATYEENASGGFDVILRNKHWPEPKSVTFQVHTKKEALECVRFVRNETR